MTRAGRALRVRGDGAGRRVPAVRVPARARAGARRLRAQRRARRARRGRGRPAPSSAFVARLAAEAPPLARVERVARERAAGAAGERGFVDRAEPAGGRPGRAGLARHRHVRRLPRRAVRPRRPALRYPFVNCTNCGPRFTIVRGVPYDRPLTTMAGFEMCARCRAEYEDPLDRRFHAQPNACPDCGPALALADCAAHALAGGDAALAACDALASGSIVAVKGLGGYHLACRADDEARGRGAARAQAPRGPAVRADGARTSTRRAALVELAADDEPRCSGARARSSSRAARPGAAVAPSVAPRSPRPRRDAPLLAAAPPAARRRRRAARDDERQRLRRADRVRRRRRARAAGGDRRPVPRCTTGRSTRAPTTRSCAAGGPLLLRRSRGYVPDSSPLPVPAARRCSPAARS